MARALRPALLLLAALICAICCTASTDEVPLEESGGGAAGGERAAALAGAPEPNAGAAAEPSSGGASEAASGGMADGLGGVAGGAAELGGAPGQGQLGGAAGGGAPSALVCHDGGMGEGATCDSFCTGWFPICSNNATTSDVFADRADCLRQCAAYTEEQLCCRGYHITNAPDNPTTHCTHSAGIRTCP